MSLETKVGGRYVLMKKLGQGSFGDIYLGRDSDKTPVAMKLEATRARHLQLAHEYRVLTSLHAGVGIPNIRWFGKEGDYRVLIMDLLGSDLEDLRLKCTARRFSLKTVLMLADQLISRLEFIHSKHYLHRDVKPENFLMGLNSNDHLIFAIDFGLAKSYRDPRTLRHATYREDCCLEGTARYASVNTHLGFEQSRRDDLESLGYMLIYLLKGSLPWQGLAGKTKAEKYAAISSKKMETTIDSLTRGLPPEFATYLTYCINLTFTAEPNYLMLRRLFREVMTREGYEFDFMYDWTKTKRAIQPAPPFIPPLPEVNLPPTPPPPAPPPAPPTPVHASISSEERESVKSVNFHADEQPAVDDRSENVEPASSQNEARESQNGTPDSQNRGMPDGENNIGNQIAYEGQYLAPADNDDSYEQNSESKQATQETKEEFVEFAVSDMGENNSEHDDQQSEHAMGAPSESANSFQANSPQPVENLEESVSPLAQTELPPSLPSPISRRGSETATTYLPTLPEHSLQHVIQITEPDQQMESSSTLQAPPPPNNGRNSLSGLRAQHKVTPLPRVSPRFSAHSATSKTLAVFGNKHASLPAPVTHLQNSSSTTSTTTVSTTPTPTPSATATFVAARSPGRLPSLPAPTRRISAGEKPWHQPRSPGRKDSKRGAASPSPKV